MKEKIAIGKIVNTRGLKGELKILPMVDDLSLFGEISYVLIQDKEYDIEGVKFFKNTAILKLAGVDSIEAAESYRNRQIFLWEEDLPEPEEGMFYVKDLLGLSVETLEGEHLGTVIDVFKTGSNDVYTVKQESGKEIYLPAIKDVVKEISPEKGFIKVVLLEGLI